MFQGNHHGNAVLIFCTGIEHDRLCGAQETLYGRRDIPMALRRHHFGHGEGATQTWCEMAVLCQMANWCKHTPFICDENVSCYMLSK